MALVKCKECGTEISSKAKVCPKCGIKREMGWLTAFVLAGCCTLIGGMFFIFLLVKFAGRTPNKNFDKEVELRKATPISYINVSARQLFYDYEANEVLADQKYKNKFVKSYGEIDKIGKDILSNSYIVIRSDNSIFGVQCFFDNAYAEGYLSKLVKGQHITVSCRVDGKLGNVILRDCN